MAPYWSKPLFDAFADKVGLPTGLPTTLKVGTDCSGFCAPELVLREIKGVVDANFEFCFCSDVSATAQDFIEQNIKPSTPFIDSIREIMKKFPCMHIYVAGFPCSDSSGLGKRAGKMGATMGVMWTCCDVVCNKKPNVFIMENVLQNGIIPTAIAELMRSLKRRAPEYEIQGFIMDAADFYGACKRPRIYVVGHCARIFSGRSVNGNLCWILRRAVAPLILMTCFSRRIPLRFGFQQSATQVEAPSCQPLERFADGEGSSELN